MKIILDIPDEQINFGKLSYVDSYLAALWHAAQWNNAASDDKDACHLVEVIGREIISRWLEKTPPELWHRQGRHEKSLPAIKENALANNVIRSARAFAENDFGPQSRDEALLQLQKDFLALDSK